MANSRRQGILSAIGALMIGVFSSPAWAQENKPADQASGPTNFVYVRYGSASVTWLVYQRSLKPVFGSPVLTIGAAPDPHGPYREYFAGLGLNLNRATYGIMPTVLFASTTDGSHLEFWASPWIETKNWSLNSFMGAYQPLSDRGFEQSFIDPLTLTRKLNSRVAVGASYLMIYTVDVGVRQGVGPAFQVYVPKGLVIADWFVGPGKSPNEFRVTLQFSF